MLRAIIVDDEELSVKRLKRILSNTGDVEICGTFFDPREAYQFVAANPIDVAFLDISMPEMNGMKLSRALLDLHASIDIVFVTGYDNYAVQAFDLSALDYLMKPVTAERLAQTLNKLGKKQDGLVSVESRIELLLFDGFNISLPRGESLKLRSPKTEELLAFLICEKSVTREKIIDTMWNDLSPDKAWKNLNSTLYYIRKAIQSSNIVHFIKADRNEIWIEETGIHCDLYEFERLLRQISLEPEQSAELFKQAEALYKGELLRGKSYEWASGQARRMEQNYIEMLESAARYHLTLNQPQKSLHYFCEILKLDGIREDINYEVIRLYMELGRENEAHRQYRTLERLLQQELGTKPGSRIRDIIN
ncbi:response regulator [Cohnella herbarum]|uniref:Response regulator n=1 Tax=Cohnella herbarum TaxID=2728023 RepID=A0A7Z2ZN14_9BACL|nr:response regulator [Cohnella herbarum]QJD84622.1 response regulator [Cohnella herbarum]